MRHLAVVLFLAAAAAAEPAYYRLELSPSGSQVSIGEPVLRGSMLVFRAYPDGKWMSVRRSDIRASTRITAKEAAGPPPASVTAIGPLAMQGGGATTSGSSARVKPAVPSSPAGQGPRVVATGDGLAITTAPK
jgi:hypothetical protein